MVLQWVGAGISCPRALTRAALSRVMGPIRASRPPLPSLDPCPLAGEILSHSLRYHLETGF